MDIYEQPDFRQSDTITCGKLICVDNWLDTYGVEPTIVSEFRNLGANVVCSGEEQFVKQAATDAYDFLVSDADHYRSAEWLDHHIRIVRNDGFMFLS